jgi:hypothetical protein
VTVGEYRSSKKNPIINQLPVPILSFHPSLTLISISSCFLNSFCQIFIEFNIQISLSHNSLKAHFFQSGLTYIRARRQYDPTTNTHRPLLLQLSIPHSYGCLCDPGLPSPIYQTQRACSRKFVQHLPSSNLPPAVESWSWLGAGFCRSLDENHNCQTCHPGLFRSNSCPVSQKILEAGFSRTLNRSQGMKWS